MVCGLSLGGMAPLQLALAAPERISELTACNTSAQVAAQPWLDRAAIVRRDGMGAIVTAVMSRFFSDRFIADVPPSLETIRATFLSIAPESYEEHTSDLPSLS